MQGLKDMEMPSAPAAEGAEMEEMDLGLGEETPEGSGIDLSKATDEEMRAEMEKRGFEVEDVPEEDMEGEVGPESDILGEEPIV